MTNPKITHPRHRRRAIGIAMALLTGLSVATVTSPALADGAQAGRAAAPPPSVGDVAPPASAGSDVGRSGQMTVAASTITCSPNVQHPHKSTHFPGKVNVVVTLFCTAQVPQINIRAALYRNWLAGQRLRAEERVQRELRRPQRRHALC